MSAPTTVRVSFWILLVGIVLDAVGAVLILLAGIGVSASGASVAGEPATISGPVLVATGAITIVFSIVEFVILWKVKAGRNWARVVITVFEILSLGTLFAGISILGVIAFAASIVAVVLLWLPSSNAFFRRSTTGATARP